jgi:hypothetical protein
MQQKGHLDLSKLLVIMLHKYFISYGSLECHEGLQIKGLEILRISLFGAIAVQSTNTEAS